MQQAISTGDPAQVSAYLSSMDKPSAVRQLTGCYGGWPPAFGPRPDGKGLFRMTAPLLHAAYTGNTAIFSNVHDAMRRKLRNQQVRLLQTSVSSGGLEQLCTGSGWHLATPNFIPFSFHPKPESARWRW